jgi:hypothetical protein
MDYGAKQLRRAWLTPEDVLNTREAEGFLGGCGRGREALEAAVARLDPRPPKVTSLEHKRIVAEPGEAWLIVIDWD